jgi:hypothetical protein
VTVPHVAVVLFSCAFALAAPVEAAGQSAPAAPKKTDSAIESDRPDFTEASSVVGRGRVQVESGYTFSRDRDGGVSGAHTYPETLLRTGAFAEWFELRAALTFQSSRVAGASAGTTTVRGLDDLYLGAKFALAEQSRFAPQLAVVVQTMLPTGASGIGAKRALPGVNLLYGWDVTTGAVTLGGSSQVNFAESQSGAFLELAQSVTVGFDFTDRLGMYGEAFSILPAGVHGNSTPAAHYANGGLRLRTSPNVQYDVRFGAGLTRASDDFFFGIGVAMRR